MNTYTVGQVATMAGITVRTLHHYDEIGLLPPTGRTQAGYRLYDDSDVDRLRTILAYRELGLGLDDVARAVTDQSGAQATLRARHMTASPSRSPGSKRSVRVSHALYQYRHIEGQ